MQAMESDPLCLGLCKYFWVAPVAPGFCAVEARNEGSNGFW